MAEANIVIESGTTPSLQEQMEKAIRDANHTPRIGNNHHWEVWDAANQVYVDTGVDAGGASHAASADIAANLESWADRADLSVIDEWTERVRTSAGDTSIVSDKGGKLVKITPINEFTATALRSTGFNLLRNATQIGTTGMYYFLVPKLVFGTYGTADTPNGVLFTNSQNSKMTPTVHFKPLSAGVPTASSYGSAATYTTSNGYRFYTCNQPGYMVVSGVTLATTCAHIAWSRRYDDYVAIDASGDAGGTVSLSSIMSALHSSDSKMLSIGQDVCDSIEFGTTAATWKRVCDKASVSAHDASSGLKWTDTPNTSEQGSTTYTHSVTIRGMKTDGAARLANGTLLNVNGTTVSYTDDNEHAAADVVVYELESIATGTVNITPTYAIEDWGLELLEGASGAAVITTAYAQGYPDSLAAIAQIKVKELVEQTELHEEEIGRLSSALYSEFAKDQDMKYGQPRILFGAGTPQASIVPDNWTQFLDGGYNWMGKPAFVGQIYINTAVSTGGFYIGYKTSNYTTEWRQIVG